eukprot:6849930-Pyramimonas_sp.AAC.1
MEFPKLTDSGFSVGIWGDASTPNRPVIAARGPDSPILPRDVGIAVGSQRQYICDVRRFQVDGSLPTSVPPEDEEEEKEEEEKEEEEEEA